MKIFNTIKYITGHPLNRKHKAKALLRFLKWQLSSRLMPYPLIYRFSSKAHLVIKRSMTSATGNLYCGLQDFEEMAFLLHFLRKEDLFIDVGANIGSYTVLASAQMGCNSLSFEPVPSTYQNLVNNININGISEKVRSFNLALGAKEEQLLITSQYDTINNIKYKEEDGTIPIQVTTLDSIQIPSAENILLKIDVEGFEAAVLEGGMKCMDNPALKAIIIEFNGLGYQYGYDEKKIQELLLEKGFAVYQYQPFERLLTKVNELGINNSIYIRNIEFVQQRLKTAPPVCILQQKF